MIAFAGFYMLSNIHIRLFPYLVNTKGVRAIKRQCGVYVHVFKYFLVGDALLVYYSLPILVDT